MLREFVVKLLEAENGADDGLRLAWARSDKMKRPVEPIPGRFSSDLPRRRRKSCAGKRRTAPEPAPMPAGR